MGYGLLASVGKSIIWVLGEPMTRTQESPEQRLFETCQGLGSAKHPVSAVTMKGCGHNVQPFCTPGCAAGVWWDGLPHLLELCLWQSRLCGVEGGDGEFRTPPSIRCKIVNQR